MFGPEKRNILNDSSSAPVQLERGLGLKEAVALNMIEIVGIGPFVVSSLVIKAMGGPQALIAWLAGALLATLDGFVWSELGAAMPKAGGTYVFLREAYGQGRWGRMMSFLFVWQTFVQAPLSVASASIGFARYAGYLHPLTTIQAKAISGGLVIFLVILLYRKIQTIGKISILLWLGVVGTMLWLIWGGFRRSRPPQHGAQGRVAERLAQRAVGPKRFHDFGRIVLLAPQLVDQPLGLGSQGGGFAPGLVARLQGRCVP